MDRILFTLSKFKSITSQYGSVRNIYDLGIIESLREDCIKWIEIDNMFQVDKELQNSWKSLTKNENIELIKSVLEELS